MATTAEGERLRSSVEKEKPAVTPVHADNLPAFERLPDEIIQQYVLARCLLCGLLWDSLLCACLTATVQDHAGDRL